MFWNADMLAIEVVRGEELRLVWMVDREMLGELVHSETSIKSHDIGLDLDPYFIKESSERDKNCILRHGWQSVVIIGHLSLVYTLK